MIDVFKVIRTLPEADVIDNQFQVTFHRFPDGLQSLEFPVDVLIDDDLFYPHFLILDGLPDRIDPGRRRDFDFQPWEAFSHEIDEVGDTHRHRVGPRFIDPFEKLDQLSVTLPGVLEVSKARSIEKVAKLQAFFVAGPDIPFDIIAVDLRQDKAGPCPTHDIEGEFPEEGIDRCSLEGIDQAKIPVRSNPEFHDNFKGNTALFLFSRERQGSKKR